VGERSDPATDTTVAQELANILHRTDEARLFFTSKEGQEVLDLITIDFQTLDDRRKREAPTRLLRIAAFNLMEHSQSFDRAFVRLLGLKRIPIDAMEPSHVVSKEARVLKKIMKTISETGELWRKELAKHLVDLTNTERDDMYRRVCCKDDDVPLSVATTGFRKSRIITITQPDPVLDAIASAFLSGHGVAGRPPDIESMRDRVCDELGTETKAFCAPLHRDLSMSVDRAHHAYVSTRDMAARDAKLAYADALRYNERYRDASAIERHTMVIERTMQHKKIELSYSFLEHGQFLPEARLLGLPLSRHCEYDPAFDPYADTVPSAEQPEDSWRL
jgi:hypothetical protein